MERTTVFGADDGIRTRDPHLGKVSESVHLVLLCPWTWSSPVSSSGKCCQIRPVSNTRYYGSLDFGHVLADRVLRKVAPRSSGSPGHYRDRALQQGNPANSCIRGNQGRTEILGESDVTGVVGRDIVPKLPDTVEEGEDRITDQSKVTPGVECVPSNSRIDLT